MAVSSTGLCDGSGAYQTAGVAEELVHYDVSREDPTNPIEVRHCLEDVVRKPVPTERTEKDIGEETLSANATTIADTGVLLLMQGVEQSTGHQVRRPY